MANVTPFNELTPAQQAARLDKYAQDRKQYNLLQGLFTVVAMKDHGVRDTKRGKVRSFGYRVVPAGAKNNDEGIVDGTYFWMNEMINMKGNSDVAIKIREGWMDALASKKVKSIRVSFDYKLNKVNGKVYRDVNSAYARPRTKKASAPVKAGQPF